MDERGAASVAGFHDYDRRNALDDGRRCGSHIPAAHTKLCGRARERRIFLGRGLTSTGHHRSSRFGLRQARPGGKSRLTFAAKRGFNPFSLTHSLIHPIPFPLLPEGQFKERVNMENRNVRYGNGKSVLGKGRARKPFAKPRSAKQSCIR